MGVEKILVVNGEPFIRKSIEECLRLRRYAVHGVGTLAEAERLLQREVFDLALLELELPDGPSMDLLERLLGEPRRPLVVMMGPSSGMEAITQAVRAGAFDYLLRPFGLNQVELLVRKAEAHLQMVKVNQHLSAAASEALAVPGVDPEMMRLRAQVRRVASTDATVLIEGEPGTGKTALARQIHRESARSGAPYLELDCAAWSEETLESHLFGHERGVFSESSVRTEGRLELADGGTLLLENVDALSLDLQEKLLHFLTTREFMRMGAVRPQKVEVRILATVRVNLLATVDRGAFLEALFYRLNVLPLRLPALRSRGEDLLHWADAFLQRFSKRLGKELSFTPDAREALLAHQWPGNLRELEIAVERAAFAGTSGGTVDAALLGLVRPSVIVENPSLLLASTDFAPLHELEREHIFRALDRCRGNRTRASEILGISVRTLRNKLHEYGVMPSSSAA